MLAGDDDVEHGTRSSNLDDAKARSDSIDGRPICLCLGSSAQGIASIFCCLTPWAGRERAISEFRALATARVPRTKLRQTRREFQNSTNIWPPTRAVEKEVHLRRPVRVEQEFVPGYSQPTVGASRNQAQARKVAA